MSKKNSESKQKTNASADVKHVTYIQSSYAVVRKDSIKIYNPSVVSTRKRVISA